jgi:hypothetical protein
LSPTFQDGWSIDYSTVTVTVAVVVVLGLVTSVPLTVNV